MEMMLAVDHQMSPSEVFSSESYQASRHGYSCSSKIRNEKYEYISSYCPHPTREKEIAKPSLLRYPLSAAPTPSHLKGHMSSAKANTLVNSLSPKMKFIYSSSEVIFT